MTLQPLYGSDAAQMVPMLLSNFSDVAAAVQQAASELRSGNQAILQSLEGRGLIQTSVPAQHGETQHEASLTRQKSSECKVTWSRPGVSSKESPHGDPLPHEYICCKVFMEMWYMDMHDEKCMTCRWRHVLGGCGRDVGGICHGIFSWGGPPHATPGHPRCAAVHSARQPSA